MLRPLRRTDAGRVVGRHAALYARDEGFDARFAADVEAAMSEFLAGAPDDCGWIAEAPAATGGAAGGATGGARDGAAPVGSILCVGAGAGAARIRLFLLEPGWRARGLGRLMLETCLAHARAPGAPACSAAPTTVTARRGGSTRGPASPSLPPVRCGAPAATLSGRAGRSGWTDRHSPSRPLHRWAAGARNPRVPP